jgi:hypothetical protein
MKNVCKTHSKLIKIIGFIVFWVTVILMPVQAGPPFNTDDPEPVEYQHWEYYISSINLFQHELNNGTLPHFEVNYGLLPDVQVHLLSPLNYNYMGTHTFQYGYANTELGLKYRFVQESENVPQIGTFPIVEIPTINNSNFGNGKAQIYLPVWIQKSWNKLSSYGGGGYWINPGTGNKNWIFEGWELQYDFSKRITLGGELYYHTAQSISSQSALAFNVGGFINFSEKFHLIFSIGHNLSNENFLTSYTGLLWTI